MLARVASTLLVFAVVLELCARTDDAVRYGAPFGGRYNREILFHTDSLGRTGSPGAHYRTWQLNSLGYRGPELEPGSLRVLCIGASETFGEWTIGTEETAGREYPRQLEQRLNARLGSNAVQVVNAAIPGQSIVTATHRLPEALRRVRPAIAIIYPSVSTYIWLPWLDAAPSPAPQPASRTKAGLALTGFEPRVAERLRTLVKGMLPDQLQTALRRFIVRRAIAQQHFPVMDTIPDTNVARFHNDLATLVRDLRANQVEPVLVTHATIFGRTRAAPDIGLILTERRYYPMLTESGFLEVEDRMNRAMRELAASEHVRIVDAAGELPAGPAYFADFAHFTALGARAMADLLAETLEPLIRKRLEFRREASRR